MALFASSYSIMAKECMVMETEILSCPSWLKPVGRRRWGNPALPLPALRTEQMPLRVVSNIPHEWQISSSSLTTQYSLVVCAILELSILSVSVSKQTGPR